MFVFVLVLVLVNGKRHPSGVVKGAKLGWSVLR